ncbi:MAG: cupin domain-containing protein [Candidatus Thermoplasmatota archaeon]|nr:cupin domain-containing protein [Candidatus Thermoplasmatota archaeon]
MSEVFDIHKRKLRIKENFKKTPVTQLNGQYVGLAWYLGEYKLHRHNIDEFVMVIEGLLSIEVEGKVHELGPGCCITIRAGEKHKSTAGTRTLVAIFEPQNVKIEWLE